MYAYRKQFWFFYKLVFFFYMWRYIAQYLKFTVNQVLFYCIQLISARFESCSCPFLKRIEYPHFSEKFYVVNFFSTNHFEKKMGYNWIYYLTYSVLISEHIRGLWGFLVRNIHAVYKLAISTIVLYKNFGLK